MSTFQSQHCAQFRSFKSCNTSGWTYWGLKQTMSTSLGFHSCQTCEYWNSPPHVGGSHYGGNPCLFSNLQNPSVHFSNSIFLHRLAGSSITSHLLYHPISLHSIIDAWAEEDCTIPAERLCHQLCDILAKHPRSPLSSLRTLSFISRTSDFLPTEAFQLLLTLGGLETLVFDRLLYIFDDSTLIKWANAWSNLKTFEVTSRKHFVTLHGVVTLLQLCRDLKYLTLSFDASKLDLIPEIPTTPCLRHGLKNWDISVSQVTPDTLGPVMAVLNWVFLDMRHVKSRRWQIGPSASELLPQSLERIAAEVHQWDAAS